MNERIRSPLAAVLEEGLACFGCSACYATCGVGAISMVADAEGFLYPLVDAGLCVGCEACRKVCPSLAAELLKRRADAQEAYAFVHSDDPLRAQSSSGGAFGAFAHAVLSSGGAVYGVAFDEGFCVGHERAGTEKEAEKFRCSKYVQSDKRDTFRQARDDLREGKRVLYTGTPCEIAGLRSFLDSDCGCEGLLTADLLCHGPASPKVFADHLAFLERRHGKLSEYNFRHKEAGANWHLHESQIVTERGRFKGFDVRAFQECFDFSYINRPSCGRCPFACQDRAGDVTLGDYWGVERWHPELDDDRGVSLVLVNSAAGHRAMAEIEEYGTCVRLQSGEYSQGVLREAVAPSPDRDAFWATYAARGYPAAIRKYTCYGLVRRIARSSRRKIRAFFGRFMGRGR